jgi:hypothetical protein
MPIFARSNLVHIIFMSDSPAPDSASTHVTVSEVEVMEADVDRDEFEEYYLQLPKVTQFKCSDLRHACFCRSVCLFDSLPTAAALRLTGGGRVEAGVWPAVVEG